jgi:hypothetical protein
MANSIKNKAKIAVSKRKDTIEKRSLNTAEVLVALDSA